MVKLCEVCGHRNAMYVCKNCDREVCDDCFNSNFWTCIKCYGKGTYQKEFQALDSSDTFFKLFLLGFLMIFIGIVLMIISSIAFKGGVSGGVTLIIGPVPILLGFGPQSPLLLSFAILLTIVILIVYLFFILNKLKLRKKFELKE
ncbi:MAG: hypothetical protein QXG01_03455 [Candidatus Bathyarchaeia archaeon]